MKYSVWKHILCLILVAIPACAMHLPASACDKVKFFNGVDVEIHRDKIINVGSLLEQGSGKRVESINAIPPDIEIIETIMIYPIEEEYPVSNGCRAVANGSHLCFETLSNRKVWISVQIEEQANEDELESAMRDAVSYVAENVLCED